MKQYVETPVSVKPEKEDSYCVILESDWKTMCYWNGTRWETSNHGSHVKSWLRPVEQVEGASDEIKTAAIESLNLLDAANLSSPQQMACAIRESSDLLHEALQPDESHQPSERQGEGDLGVSQEVAAKIMLVRDAYLKGNMEDVYHHLYSIASPGFDKYEPWKRLIEIAGDKYTPILPGEGAIIKPALPESKGSEQATLRLQRQHTYTDQDIRI